MSDTWDGLVSLIGGTSQESSLRAASDICAMFESMWRNARAEPDLLFVSMKDARRIRRLQALSKIYAAHRLPHRKFRKCFARKRQATIRREKRRVLRQLDIKDLAMHVERKGRGEPLPFDGAGLEEMEIADDEIMACIDEFHDILAALPDD